LVEFCGWGYAPGHGWEPNDLADTEDSLCVVFRDNGLGIGPTPFEMEGFKKTFFSLFK
jgi:hypothetical protein